jgi:hypothetical protein
MIPAICAHSEMPYQTFEWPASTMQKIIAVAMAAIAVLGIAAASLSLPFTEVGFAACVIGGAAFMLAAGLFSPTQMYSEASCIGAAPPLFYSRSIHPLTVIRPSLYRAPYFQPGGTGFSRSSVSMPGPSFTHRGEERVRVGEGHVFRRPVASSSNPPLDGARVKVGSRRFRE